MKKKNPDLPSALGSTTCVQPRQVAPDWLPAPLGAETTWLASLKERFRWPRTVRQYLASKAFAALKKALDRHLCQHCQS
jgi:hypothetical protein